MNGTREIFLKKNALRVRFCLTGNSDRSMLRESKRR
jgi:hypothetical protein